MRSAETQFKRFADLPVSRTIVAPASSAELAHLISVQYIMRQALNLDTKQYVITRLGRQALAEATAE